MDQLINTLLVEYPILTKILLVMGLMRLIFKPLMASLQNYVNITDSVEDNAKLHKFMTSKWYFILSFLFDLSASIKLPQIKDK